MMKVPNHIRGLVRQRANFSCEFCGVSETDAGGELTVDHFQPQTKGGTNDPDNLLYCCERCNKYKLAYFPSTPGKENLWNPRFEPFSLHFIESENGVLLPLTTTGAFTITRLRLNRPPLVAHRLRKQKQLENLRLFEHYQELLQLQQQLNDQLSSLADEQRKVLAEQQQILKLLLRNSGKEKPGE